MKLMLIPLVTIRFGVEVMGTEFTDMILFVMQFFQPLSLLLLRQEERCHLSFGYVASLCPFLCTTTCCRQLDPLLYSVDNIHTRQDVGVADNC